MSVVTEQSAPGSQVSSDPTQQSSPPKRPAQADRPALPDASVLEDKTPRWFRTPGIGALFTAILGAVFVVLSHLPLAPNDLWDHINYGRFTLETRQIAKTEPLLELARGIPVRNVHWLSQVGMASLMEHYGPASLQFSHALMIVLSLGLVSWVTVRRTGSVTAGFFAAGLFLVINHLQFQIARPQTLAVLLFTILSVWSLQPRFTLGSWLGIPLLFMVWANCHGSFPAGLILLACITIGTAIDQGRHGVRFGFLSPSVVRLFLITQLAIAATLLNPSGLGVYTEVLQISSHPNIDSMYEWLPLTLRTVQGKLVIGAALFLMVVIKCSPRRVRAVEVLPLAVFGVMTLWSARMINWFAPWAAIVGATHGIACVRNLWHMNRRTTPFRRTGLWTIVSLGLCWICFALTNFGVLVVQGRQPDVRRLLTIDTPVDLAAFLNQEKALPPGTAWVPAEWSGYLKFAGPKSLSPMVNLHVHLIPPEVWEHYTRLLTGPSDWDDLLDQYSINLVIVDKQRHPGLLRRLAESADWEVHYSDRQAVVFYRKTPV